MLIIAIDLERVVSRLVGLFSQIDIIWNARNVEYSNQNFPSEEFLFYTFSLHFQLYMRELKNLGLQIQLGGFSCEISQLSFRNSLQKPLFFDSKRQLKERQRVVPAGVGFRDYYLYTVPYIHRIHESKAAQSQCPPTTYLKFLEKFKPEEFAWAPTVEIEVEPANTSGFIPDDVTMEDISLFMESLDELAPSTGSSKSSGQMEWKLAGGLEDIEEC